MMDCFLIIDYLKGFDFIIIGGMKCVISIFYE